jgi:hypothetical protein
LIKGVGTLTAMDFLTEIGDLNRFANRRQLAAWANLFGPFGADFAISRNFKKRKRGKYLAAQID